MTGRRRGVTEQAAVAAIEQACRMLRLPTMRDRFTEIAAAAEREQLSYLGFLAELVMAGTVPPETSNTRRSMKPSTWSNWNLVLAAMVFPAVS